MIESFPSNFVAQLFGFRLRDYFEIEDEATAPSQRSRSRARGADALLLVRFALAALRPSPVLCCAGQGRRADPVLRFDRRGAERRGARRRPRRSRSRRRAARSGAASIATSRSPSRTTTGPSTSVTFDVVSAHARRRARAVLTPIPTARASASTWARRAPTCSTRQLHYQLRYTTGRQIRFFPDHTELFWNVTGNDWSFPILSATARIALPGSARRRCAGPAIPAASASAATISTADPRRRRARGRHDHAHAQPRRGPALVASRSRPGCRAGRAAAAVLVLVPRQHALHPSAASASRRLGFYLLAWSAVGRDPPKGDDHPAVPSAEGHFAGARRLHPELGLERGGWRDSPRRRCRSRSRACSVSSTMAADADIVLTRTDKPEPTGE